MTKRYQGQIVIYKALHRRPKIGQYEPHLKPVVNSCDLEGLAVQAPHVTPVVLLLAVIIQCMEHRFTGFSTNHAVLTRKSKDWLDWNEGNVSEWINMSTRRLSFQLVSL
jgi:hypothetical protein